MPDFHTSVASLKLVQRSLDTAIAAEPATANATMRLRAALAVAPDMAVFGALLDAILYHCGPTQPELGLLTDAAKLWQQYRPLMERLSKARALLDSLVTNPTQPGMAVETRNLSASLHHLGADIHDWSFPRWHSFGSSSGSLTYR